MKRSALKRRPRRASDSAEYRKFWAAVTRGGKASCWLSQFSPVPCEGMLDAAHLLPKQRLLRLGLGSDQYDPRLGVPACRRHHHQLDVAKTLVVPRRALPLGVEQFAEQRNLGWMLEREYGGIPDGGAPQH